MYSLVFDEKAIEFLEKLPAGIRGRIFTKLQAVKPDPFRYFERLEGRPEYKLRVGDYRVIADLDRKRILILVLHIGHRKNVYDRI